VTPHGHATPAEIQRHFIDLYVALVDAKDLVKLHVLQNGNVEQLLQTDWKWLFSHAYRSTPSDSLPCRSR
jgi:hypothetical protein